MISRLRLDRLILPLVAMAVAPVLQAQPPAIRPADLRCEYLVNPLGIDVARPRLSWVIEGVRPGDRGLKQSAYRILVASTRQALDAGTGDLWDSGKVASDQSVQVVYGGKSLASGSFAFWKAEVWDHAGNSSGWSAPADWSMGLLKPDDWQGKWIGLDATGPYKRPGSPYHSLENARWIWWAGGDGATAASPGDRFFRASFDIPQANRVVKAVCVIAADHEFELFVNGVRAGKGNNVRLPEIIEVASYLKPGSNVMAVRARNGGANKPAGLIGAVRVEFTKGQPIILSTGNQWKSAETAASDWEKAGFNDSAWSAAKELGAFGMKPWGEVGFIEERALPARMLRKEFEVAGKPKRAMAFVSGLGLFELYVNGTKIGNQVLSPGLTDYDKHVQYVTFDITPQLNAGRNAIGLVLGNGRYHAPREGSPLRSRTFGYPKAIVQLDVENADGSAGHVVTDGTWKLATNGPIRGNSEYDGEEYDARMEIDGWSRPGFKDSAWQPAQLVQPPSGELVAEMAEPLRVVETLHPVSVRQLRPGVFIADMGQNMVGWCRLKVSGTKGTQVTLRHAETLQENGELYVENLRSAQATDTYTIRSSASLGHRRTRRARCDDPGSGLHYVQ
jgi:alpha-L-rhamnosidase